MNQGLYGLPQTPSKLLDHDTPLIPGTWCAPSPLLSGFTTGATLSGARHLTPIHFSSTVVIESWFVNVVTAVASSSVEVGLYRVVSAKNMVLVSILGSVDSSSTGNKTVTISPLRVESGDYVALFQAGSAAVALTSYATGRWGVRLTDPGIFTGYQIAGLLISFTGMNNSIPLGNIGASGNNTAPIIAFKIKEVAE